MGSIQSLMTLKVNSKDASKFWLQIIRYLAPVCKTVSFRLT